MHPFSDDAPVEQRSVRRLADLGPFAQHVIWLVRRWLDGDGGRRDVWSDLSQRLGPRRARSAMVACDAFLTALTAHPARTLYRHSTGGADIGADELTVTRLVAAAGSDRLDLAYAEASALARPEQVGVLMQNAAELGRALAPLAARIRGSAAPAEAPVGADAATPRMLH
ncbi:MAG: hypothetical protein AAF909_10835 [Pseudomonadota bacterium]